VDIHHIKIKNLKGKPKELNPIFICLFDIQYKWKFTDKLYESLYRPTRFFKRSTRHFLGPTPPTNPCNL